MGSRDALAILPILILSATSVIVLLAIAFHRNHTLVFLMTLGGEAASALALIPASKEAPRRVASLLIVDSYSIAFMALLLAGSFVVMILAYGYLEKHQEEKEEYYVLLILATAGSLTLACSTHFVSFFLALEILSVSLYPMIGYLSDRRMPLEAGLKYLILAGASTSFIVFGMALVYAAAGSMDFLRIASAANRPGALSLSGFALIVSGVGFKLALVPFHMWTPDVYQGAPAPTAAFVATISKGAVFAFLLRYFLETDAHQSHSLFVLLSAISIASMIAGNLLALLQDSIKRVLAYSSIANLGYLLVAFLTSRDFAIPASIFYLAAYFAGILTAFGAISLLSTGESDADSLDLYRGLFWRKPWLAGALTASLFSLAGIPLTAGFVGKFYILTAGIGSTRWLLAFVLVVTSGVGLFYYLRIIVGLYSPLPEILDMEPQPADAGFRWMTDLVIAGLTLLVILLGIFPALLLRMI
jgi:NADH-quinone oxidoreductase subunit N